MSVMDRIRAAGIVLPAAEMPRALYVPYTLHHGLLTISGQLPLQDGKPMFVGKVPGTVSVEAAQAAARLCLANLLGWASAATDGNLERIRGIVRVGGYVAADPGFDDAPRVINAASELLNQIFAERGRHARLALGVASLPFGAPVEIEATFALDA
ncbi:RidA family protein [Cupriavidus necator]|uniref:RidA family protein n=1 Tax=Cupriavidus necator TaxID=106590 RepID=UPI00277F4C9D|nr:RidA family protein [Cupriavidus necator]MDQ0138869.1 enamine deaminase RidA (YjgF/YER057c/UK114 family) [Cupriavidus necator]